MQIIIESAKENIDSALKHLEREMLNIRAGKANPIMLSGVKVEYYGTPTVISQVANINTPDNKTLVIQPWDKSILGDVKSLTEAGPPDNITPFTLSSNPLNLLKGTI